MLGTVQINKQNMMQGEATEVERRVLFIGSGAGVNEDNLLSLGPDSDLDNLIGACDLKTQLEYARDNAGSNWTAYAIPLADEASWQDAVDHAMELVNVEGIALTDPVSGVSDIENLQRKAVNIFASHVRPLFMACRAPQMEASESWSAYQIRLAAITNDVVADQVSITPSIWGYELGAYVGRLCNSSVSIADSPMRTKTGALVGEWTERPVDADGVKLNLAYLKTLSEDLRYSVPQWHYGYDGMFWADGVVLDQAVGDFSKIENLRIINKCIRRVHPMAVSRIADRNLNQTPASMALAKLEFAKPLQSMSQGFILNGVEFPGDIVPPDDDAISISWESRESVVLGITAQPYNCPKKITVNLALDLTNYAA